MARTSSHKTGGPADLGPNAQEPEAAGRVYLERYGPDAIRRLEAVVAGKKQDDPFAAVTVVAPTRYSALSLRRTLAGAGGIANVKSQTVSDLAGQLASARLAGKGGSLLSRYAETAAIRETSEHVNPDGPLATTAQHPRLHRSLRATFQELDQLSQPARLTLEGMDPLRAEIVRWHRRCRDSLGGLYGGERVAAVAAEAVVAGDKQALDEAGHVVFHLVYALSPAETELVEALYRAGRCTVIVGLLGDDSADAAARDLAARLCEGREPAGTDRSAGPPPRADHVVSAPDAHEEGRWITRRILKDAELGVPFHRMAVLYRQAFPYAQILADQFKLAGVPAAGPDRRPLRNTPAGKLIDLFQAVVAENFSRSAVLRWIAEAPIGGQIPGQAAYDELHDWESISREAGVVESLDQWLERLPVFRERTQRKIDSTRDSDDVTPTERSRLQRVLHSAARLERFIGDLAEHAAPPNAGGLRDCSNWAKTLLAKYAHEVAEWPEEHKGALTAIERSLDEIADLDHRFPNARPEDFRILLQEALGESSRNLGRLGAGVFVGSLDSAQCMDFESVYLVGMAEGAFPPKTGEDAMLPDSVRRTIEDGRTPDRTTAREVQERRSYLSSMAAGRSVFLSYPRAEPSGQRAQHPSPWILEAAGGLHGAPVASNELQRLASEPWMTVIESAEHGLVFARTVAPADQNDHDVASVSAWRASRGLLRDHYLASEEPLARALEMDAERSSRRFTRWDGRVSELAHEGTRLSLPQRGELSPTSLERWAACPFSYLLGHVLDLSALEAPAEELSISPLERGILVHGILEKFVDAAISDGIVPAPGEPWGENGSRLLYRIAEKEFADAEGRGITGRRLLWQVAKEDIRDDLERFIAEDDVWRSEGWQPAATEQRFGFSASDRLPAPSIELPDGSSLRFRGLIDRIDVRSDGKYAAVIDYKTGGASAYSRMKADPLDRGRRLQLPVYSTAVLAADGMPDNVEAHYWFVSERGKFERRKVVLEEVDKQFKETAGVISSGIASGLFPANPGKAVQNGWENCRFCDFNRVCPSNRDRMWEMKRTDDALLEYAGLAGDESE